MSALPLASLPVIFGRVKGTYPAFQKEGSFLGQTVAAPHRVYPSGSPAPTPDIGLSKYAAEAAEHAAEHRDKLGIAGKVKDVAGVHKTLWPAESNPNEILQIGVLIGTSPVYKDETREGSD